MSWLDFFQTTQSTCSIHFGRGVNAAISPHEEELFQKSAEAFEKKEIINAYEYFFQSITNYTDANSNKNIILKREKEKLLFEIFQGTARVTGVITQENLSAEVSIVRKQNATVALKRYILERNYQLTYANYYSDDKYIKIKLYQDNITLSPQKIFFPLRELALNADFDKSYIKSEFSDINLEDIVHLQSVDTKELAVKYKYLKEWIKTLENKVLTLPSNDHSGMEAFLYLNLLFKIDYLLVPKYKLYQRLSKKIQAYFSDEHSTIEAKNDELKKYVEQLATISFEEFCTNFYSAKSTFNQIEKSQHDDVVNFINESQAKIRWYKNNRYSQVTPTIYTYIAFYSLYNYGMNPVLKELLHTLIEIHHSDFFKDLDCETLYNEEKQEFSKRIILSKMKAIVELHQNKYKALDIFTDDLNFSSLDAFNYSFYAMIKNLDFEEI